MRDDPDTAATEDNPEVLPPEGESSERPPLWNRLEQAFGPLLAGLIIDGMDLVTYGPMGLMFGMLLGGSAAFWMASIYRLPAWQRLLCALAAGLYCSIPRTEPFPVATLIGAFGRFFQRTSR